MNQTRPLSAAASRNRAYLSSQHIEVLLDVLRTGLAKTPTLTDCISSYKSYSRPTSANSAAGQRSVARPESASSKHSSRRPSPEGKPHTASTRNTKKVQPRSDGSNSHRPNGTNRGPKGQTSKAADAHEDDAVVDDDDEDADDAAVEAAFKQKRALSRAEQLRQRAKKESQRDSLLNLFIQSGVNDSSTTAAGAAPEKRPLSGKRAFVMSPKKDPSDRSASSANSQRPRTAGTYSSVASKSLPGGNSNVEVPSAVQHPRPNSAAPSRSKAHLSRVSPGCSTSSITSAITAETVGKYHSQLAAMKASLMSRTSVWTPYIPPAAGDCDGYRSDGSTSSSHGRTGTEPKNQPRQNEDDDDDFESLPRERELRADRPQSAHPKHMRHATIPDPAQQRGDDDGFDSLPREREPRDDRPMSAHPKHGRHTTVPDTEHTFRKPNRVDGNAATYSSRPTSAASSTTLRNPRTYWPRYRRKFTLEELRTTAGSANVLPVKPPQDRPNFFGQYEYTSISTYLHREKAACFGKYVGAARKSASQAAEVQDNELSPAAASAYLQHYVAECREQDKQAREFAKQLQRGGSPVAE